MRGGAPPPPRSNVAFLSKKMEMKVSMKKGIGFYMRSATAFLKGIEAKPADGDQAAVEAHRQLVVDAETRLRELTGPTQTDTAAPPVPAPPTEAPPQPSTP